MGRAAGTLWALWVACAAVGCLAVDEVVVDSPASTDGYIRNVLKEIRKETGENAHFSPGSPLHDRAINHAKERLLYSETPSQFQVKEALFGSLKSSFQQLGFEGSAEGIADFEGDEWIPAVEEAISGVGNDTIEQGESALSARTEIFNAVATFRNSIKVQEDVATGAIAKAGALSEEVSRRYGLRQTALAY